METITPPPQTGTRLKTRQMALLLALDEARNLHQAARQTHMSQPAASKMLRDIETLFGVPLFDRLPRGIRPTLYGDTMIRHVRMAMGNLLQGQESVSALRAGLSGQVRIGTILTASTTLVPQAVLRAKAMAPGLGIQIQVDTSDQLLQRLAAGNLDFLIARLQSQEDESTMVYEDLSEESVCAVARVGHPMAQHPQLTLADLSTAGWILSPRGSILRHRFDMMFRRARLEPPALVVETTVLSVVTSLLQNSGFLHVMPLEVARSCVASAQMALLPIDLPCQMDSFGIITRRDQIPSGGAQLLLAQIRAVASEIYLRP
jgi:DNA-binding transcriptional LysR family regulator